MARSMLLHALVPALLAASVLAFHPTPPPRPPSLRRAGDADLAAFSLNDLKTLAAARGIDVSGMTEKADVTAALKAPRTPAEEEPAPVDEVAFNPLAALMDANGLALDGSAFEAAPVEADEDLDFDPRVSPHAYEAAPNAVGVLIVDHGSRVDAANERLERLCIEAGAHSTSSHRHLSVDQPDLSCGTEGGGAVGSLISPCVVVVFVGAGLQSGEHMFPMVWLPEVSEGTHELLADAAYMQR